MACRPLGAGNVGVNYGWCGAQGRRKSANAALSSAIAGALAQTESKPRRSARSANSSSGAACGCPAMFRVGSKYPMRMDIAFSAPIVNAVCLEGIASRNHNDRDRSSLLAWLRGRSCATARLALENNGHDSSALLWTFLRERHEGSGRELFAFCCPYRFFIDAQTKARTVW